MRTPSLTHRHDSGVKALIRSLLKRAPGLYLTKCRSVVFKLIDGRVELLSRPRLGFQQGRHYEHPVDASALRADEGRGRAAISVGEPRAGTDPTISEWGNPSTLWRPSFDGGYRGN